MRKELFGLLLLVIAMQGEAFAQNGTSSPYSQFGIGELQSPVSIISKGMGGANLGLAGEKTFNVNNPASYSSLKFTSFETAAFYTLNLRTDGVNKDYAHNGTFSYLNLGFPVTKKMGAAFGLTPFSFSGYESKTDEKPAPGGGTYHNLYKGSGGVNNFFIGLGYTPIKNLSLGVNLNYAFGSLNESSANEFKDTVQMYNTRVITKSFVSDFYLKFGLQYQVDLKKDQVLRFGYSGSLENNLSAKRTKVSERYVTGNSGTEVVLDTILNLGDIDGALRLPNQNSLGFVWESKNKWILAGDVFQGQWSQFRKFGADPGLRDSYGFALGYDFIPNFNGISNIFQLMNYRFGVHYGVSSVKINNSSVGEYGASIGFGIPLIKSGSKINIAFDYLRRGAASNGLIKEDLYNVSLGLLISDKWFRRYKYD